MLMHTGAVPLETADLLLRPLSPDDAGNAYESWVSDPQVAQFMPWQVHTSLDMTRAWLERCAEMAQDLTHYEWAVVHRETDVAIGSISVNLDEEDPEHGRAEVGYAIGRRFWGRGYATQALARTVAHMAHTVGVRHFIGKRAMENGASGTVMEHVGFSPAGEGAYESFDGQRTFLSRVYHLDLDEAAGHG